MPPPTDVLLMSTCTVCNIARHGEHPATVRRVHVRRNRKIPPPRPVPNYPIPSIPKELTPGDEVCHVDTNVPKSTESGDQVLSVVKRDASAVAVRRGSSRRVVRQPVSTQQRAARARVNARSASLFFSAESSIPSILATPLGLSRNAWFQLRYNDMAAYRNRVERREFCARKCWLLLCFPLEDVYQRYLVLSAQNARIADGNSGGIVRAHTTSSIPAGFNDTISNNLRTRFAARRALTAPRTASGPNPGAPLLPLPSANPESSRSSLPAHDSAPLHTRRRSVSGPSVRFAGPPADHLLAAPKKQRPASWTPWGPSIGRLGKQLDSQPAPPTPAKKRFGGLARSVRLWSRVRSSGDDETPNPSIAPRAVLRKAAPRSASTPSLDTSDLNLKLDLLSEPLSTDPDIVRLVNARFSTEFPPPKLAPHAGADDYATVHVVLKRADSSGTSSDNLDSPLPPPLARHPSPKEHVRDVHVKWDTLSATRSSGSETLMTKSSLDDSPDRKVVGSASVDADRRGRAEGHGFFRAGFYLKMLKVTVRSRSHHK